MRHKREFDPPGESRRRERPIQATERQQYNPAPLGYNLSELSALMKDTQINYNRLNFSDFTKELAPRPVTMTQKVQLPEHFTCLFPNDTQISALAVSGKKYSFWHALLTVLLPDFLNTGWVVRKTMVEEFIDELAQTSMKTFLNDSILSQTNHSHELIRYRGDLPEDLLYYYICTLFDVNIISIDNIQTSFHFAGVAFRHNIPTILLYQDDNPMFYPLAINGKAILHGGSVDAMCLFSHAPKVNSVLQGHVCLQKYPELYKTVHALTDQQLHAETHRLTLGKFKLVELQALAEPYLERIRNAAASVASADSADSATDNGNDNDKKKHQKRYTKAQLIEIVLEGSYQDTL